MDLITRLWGITTELVGFISQSLVLRSIVLGWIWIYRNWAIDDILEQTATQNIPGILFQLDFKSAIQVLSDFGAFPGLRLNLSKTKALWLALGGTMWMSLFLIPLAYGAN